MAIRIDGTNTAANPGITGADADTGLQFGTDEIQLVTGGTNRATVESNGNFTIEDGNLVVASGHGIDFSATGDGSGTVTSELLNDYEEGIFTPTLGAGSSTVLSNVTYSRRNGTYVKIGRTVYFLIDIASSIAWGSISGSSEGLTIQGLPFTMEQIGPNQTGSKFAVRNYSARHWSTPWPTSQSPSNDSPVWGTSGTVLYSRINRNGNSDYTYTVSDWDAAAGNTTRTFEAQLGGTYTTES